MLIPGESYRDKALYIGDSLDSNPYPKLERLDETAIAIRYSVSEVGFNGSSVPRHSISIDPEKLGTIISKSISKAVFKIRDSPNMSLQMKLV